MALPIFFTTIEDTLDTNGMPIVKLSTANRSSFGGNVFESYILPENSGGTVSAALNAGISSNIYETKMDISAGMALLFNANGQFVTPIFGQAITSVDQPFNYIGTALTSTQAVSDNWNQSFPSVMPSAREACAMAYFGPLQSVVMFGGVNNGSYMSDTWAWNGVTWTQILPTTSPSARSNCSMVFDSSRNVLVLFGGLNYLGDVQGDTWEYNGVNWNLITPSSHHPDGRIDYGLTFDSNINKTVLFGGTNTAVLYNDTWEWNGTDWDSITTSIQPSARSGLAIAFDSGRQVSVLFGGISSPTSATLTSNVGLSDMTINVISTSGFPTFGLIVIQLEHISYSGITSTSFLGCVRGVDDTLVATHLSSDPVLSYVVYNDVWEYDGYWSQVHLTGALPSPRSQARIAFDSTEKVIQLFGGISSPVSNAGDVSDTWNYDGNKWTQISIFGPSARESFGLAYDPSIDKSVLFGGANTALLNANGETWQFGSLLRSVEVQVGGDALVYYDAYYGPLPVINDFLGPSGVDGAVTPIYDGYSPVFGIAVEAPIAYETNLSSGINNSVTTIPVDDTSAFPVSGVITIDAEQISYTGISSTTFTGCVRGVNSTTPTTHSSGALVYSPIQLILNDGSLVGLIKMRTRPFYGFISPASPSITDFTPSAGIVGSTITLNGSVFIGTTEVTIDGYDINATFDIISNNKITFIVPADAQQGTIKVTNAQGNSISIDLFTTLPIIGSITGGTFAVGASITLIGHTFTYATSLTFNGINQPAFTVVNDTEITTTIPVGATSGNVILTITYPSTETFQAIYSNFDIYAPPVISVVSPSQGPIGNLAFTTLTSAINNSIVTIPVLSTNGFLSSGTIIIDNEEIAYAGITSSTFTGCVRGANATVAASHLINAAVLALTINPTGYVSISGSGFLVPGSQLDGYGNVEFVDVATETQILTAKRNVFNDSLISVVVPSPGMVQASKAYYVRMITYGGTITSSQTFTIIPAPKFLQAATTTLSSGINASVVTIPAVTTSFEAASNFFIDNEQISYTGTTGTTFTGCVRGINGTTAAAHSMSASIATKTFISQSNNTNGITGQIVRIFGDFGFTGASSVLFNGVASPSISKVNDGYITAVIPVISALINPTGDDFTGPISVTSIGGTKSTMDVPTTAPVNFTVLQAPTISSIFNANALVVNPQAGATGDTIVITGTNLTGVSNVIFSADGYATFTVVNSTTINATVPSSTSGISFSPGPITITKGPIAPFTFVVSSVQNFAYYPPPTDLTVASPSTPLAGFNGGYGTQVVLDGYNFVEGSILTIQFGAAFGIITSQSPTTLTATIPSGGTSGLTLTTSGGVATINSLYFVVLQPTTISSFYTNSIIGGRHNVGVISGWVDVYGSNFLASPNMSVSIISPAQGNASVSVSYTFFTSTHIQFAASTLGAFIGNTCIIQITTPYRLTSSTNTAYVASVYGLSVVS
jgi:hypothetical protein